MMTPAEKAVLLRHTFLFAGCGVESLRSAAEAAEPVRFSPGDLVVREGDEGEALFVVASGFLRAYRIAGTDRVWLGDIQKGDFFGEFSLLEPRPRTATVEAMSPTLLLRLPATAVASLQKHDPAIQERMEEVLGQRRAAGAPPMAPSNEERWTSLARILELVDTPGFTPSAPDLSWHWLRPGAVLFHEGEPGDRVYFVMEGELRIFTLRGGVSVYVGRVGPNETLGEVALLSGEPRSASAMATSSVLLLGLEREAFDAFIAAHPETLASFRNRVLQRVEGRIRAEAAWHAVRTHTPLTLEDCEDVVRTRDLVLRNVKITQSYHRLALDLVDLLGDDHLNWPAFGAYASRSAGYAIRHEEIPAFLEVFRRPERFGSLGRTLGDALERSLLLRTLERVLAHVSQGVSDGNLRIFTDMAPIIVRFVEVVRAGGEGEHDAVESLLGTLAPGPTERGGQELLGEALRAWHTMRHTESPKLRAELMLLGNLRMGLHEQTRIQADLEQSLDAPLRVWIGDEFALAVDSLTSCLPYQPRATIVAHARAIEQGAIDALTTAFRRFVTRRLMRLRLPGGDLKLGSDVLPPQGTSVYPPELEELSHPELRALAASIARNADSNEGGGAVDWTRLPDRMNFILQLFRTRQNDRTLLDPPLENWRLELLAPTWQSVWETRPEG